MARSSSFASPVLFAAFALLAGCPSNNDNRDAGRPPDSPVAPVDAPLPDVPGADVPMVDTGGGGRMCTVGGAGACDVILQNCPDDAGGNPQGCYLATMGAGTPPTTLCAPIMGTLPEGSACTGLQQCADGLHCAGGGTDGFCREYCCMGSATDCPIGQTCLPYGDGSTTFNVGVCTPPASCEVVPQSGCDADETCVPNPDTSRLCVSAGTIALGAECGGTISGNCVVGAACVGPASGPSYCRSYCRLGMTDCTGTDTCTAIGGIGPAFGVCFPPG